MTYKVMNSTQKQSFDTMGTAGFVPYYRLEPNVVSGAVISGTVTYSSTADKGLQSYAYTFSAEGLKDGDYCIRANPNGIAENVVSLAETYTSNLFVKLAYVTISNGSFTDFRLVGDGYLKNQISTAEGRAKKYAEDYAKEKDAETLALAQKYADIKADSAQTHADNAVSAHNADTAAHSDIRDRIDMLQKYPCYEHSTSGAAVQRFDDVSVIPHNISITVHGATDENGNSVTNPTVSVYGKNMHVFNYKNIRGYTFSGSNCKIVNPTQFYENPNNPSLLLPAGTYTFSCRVTGSREYANKPNFSAFFYIGETQTNIDMNNFVSGTKTFKKTFTVTEQTAFRFNNVWFIETPTSADLSLDFQLEVGSTVTEYEPYIEPQTVTVPMSFADGEVCEIGVLNAVSPTMTVIATDDNGLISTVDIKYNRDVKKALDKLEAAIAALV